MGATLVGFDGLRSAGAFGVLPAIVDAGHGRVRVERAVPVELTRDAFDTLADERRITRLARPFPAPDQKPVVLYVDWDAACDPRLFDLYFGRSMIDATERMEHLLPDADVLGPRFRMLVRDRAGAACWAENLLTMALESLRTRPLPSVRACWRLVQWLEFVVPYTDQHRERFAGSVYAWLLALAKTGQVPNVRPESVRFDIKLRFAPHIRPEVERRADVILAMRLPTHASRVLRAG